MSTAIGKQEVTISWDAGKLAFRIGMAIDRALIQGAIERVEARRGSMVSVADVEALAAEINVAAACRIAKVAIDAQKECGESERSLAGQSILP